MRSKLCVILLLVPLLLAFLAAPVAAEEYTVTIKVIGKDNKPLAGAAVTVFIDGVKKAYGTTDENGTFTFSAGNGTYFVVIEKGFIVFETVTVAGAPVTKTVNLTTGYVAVNVSTLPVAVPYNATILAKNQYKLTGNATIYVLSGATLNLTFPKEYTKVPYKYTLKKITYDGSETTEPAVSLSVTKDMFVTAEYAKTFYFVLPTWALLLLLVVLVSGIAIAYKASAATVRKTLAERRRFWRAS